MSKRYTFARPYKDAYEIVDRAIDKALNPEDVTDLLNHQQERIAELEEQLKNARKETAKKVIDRVEELGVFDFEAYEEMDFRRYIISQMALDNILKEYGENNG